MVNDHQHLPPKAKTFRQTYHWRTVFFHSSGTGLHMQPLCRDNQLDCCRRCNSGITNFTQLQLTSGWWFQPLWKILISWEKLPLSNLCRGFPIPLLIPGGYMTQLHKRAGSRCHGKILSSSPQTISNLTIHWVRKLPKIRGCHLCTLPIQPAAVETSNSWLKVNYI